MKPSEVMNDIIYNNNQHPERTGIPSELPESIVKAYECSFAKAIQLATTHCNAITFYAVLYSCKFISMPYSSFLKWGKRSGAINVHGFFDWEKEDILDKICSMPIRIIEYKDKFDTALDKIFQIKITNKHGTHFMCAYTSGGNWFISDPNYRGVGVLWDDALQYGDKVEWIKEFTI